MSVASKVAVVTGSADNIGAATARKFAAEGAAVIVNARRNVEGGQRVADEILKAGGKAKFVQADVSDPAQAQRLIDETLAAFGRLDILINNAGGFEQAMFLESSVDHWNRMFADNVLTAVNCSQAAAKVMPKPGGRIVNMASIRGLTGGGRPGGMAYSAAKAAVINLTKTMAMELAPHIAVNAVAPGYTKTTAFVGLPQELIDSFLETTLLKRWLSPEEIADAFYFLATATGITGEVLVVDAGWNAT